MNLLPGNLICALPPCSGFSTSLNLTLNRTPIAVRSSYLSCPVSLVAALNAWCKVSNSCPCNGSTATLDLTMSLLKRIKVVTTRFRTIPPSRAGMPRQVADVQGKEEWVRHNTQAGICIYAKQPSPGPKLLQTSCIPHSQRFAKHKQLSAIQSMQNP